MELCPAKIRLFQIKVTGIFTKKLFASEKYRFCEIQLFKISIVWQHTVRMIKLEYYPLPFFAQYKSGRKSRARSVHFTIYFAFGLFFPFIK